MGYILPTRFFQNLFCPIGIGNGRFGLSVLVSSLSSFSRTFSNNNRKITFSAKPADCLQRPHRFQWGFVHKFRSRSPPSFIPFFGFEING